jgi:hypothetical protein
MSLLTRRKLTWTRVVAAGACLVALTVYSAFTPTPSHAEYAPLLGACECKAGNEGTFTEGACHNNQTCECVHGDDGCANCIWVTGCN